MLKKLAELELDADHFGFQWENPHQIMAQIQSECLEINEHLSQVTDENRLKLQEEIGDLLHAAFSLCLFCKFDPEDTLKNSIDKFERRLNAVKSITEENGIATLNGYAFDELMRFWDAAKKRVG